MPLAVMLALADLDMAAAVKERHDAAGFGDLGDGIAFPSRFQVCTALPREIRLAPCTGCSGFPRCSGRVMGASSTISFSGGAGGDGFLLAADGSGIGATTGIQARAACWRVAGSEAFVGALSGARPGFFSAGGGGGNPDGRFHDRVGLIFRQGNAGSESYNQVNQQGQGQCPEEAFECGRGHRFAGLSSVAAGGYRLSSCCSSLPPSFSSNTMRTG